MATKFVPLEEAARLLGIDTDKLVEMRSQGEIRAFRDGASWKFPQDEIDRLLADRGIDVLGEDPLGGSSILVSEREVGPAGSKGGSAVIGGDEKQSSGAGGSDVRPGDEGSGKGSDLELVARPGQGSDVALVASGSDARRGTSESSKVSLADEVRSGSGTGSIAGADSGGLSGALGDDDEDDDSDSDVLELVDDDFPGATEKPSEGSKGAVDVGDAASVLSDVNLLESEQGGTGDLIQGDSDPAIVTGSDIDSSADDALSDDDELVLGDDDDDDLMVAGVGSDISIAGDSGINLTSPSDSGLSLESEPLDLAGSSISALDLAGSDVDPAGSGSRAGSGSGSGSVVDFQTDEEFQLSPSGIGLDAEEDSGSQVIEVEDSAEFGEELDLGEGGFAAGEDQFGTEEVLAGEGIDIDPSLSPQARSGGAVVAYEIPFTVWQVAGLAFVLVMLGISGMLMTDVVRNMFTYAEPAGPVMALAEALTGLIGT